MRTTENIVSKLKENQSSTPSKWREHAEWCLANKSWLRHSQQIAMMMLDRMDELNMSQKQLAERMGCSQQYVSKVLKGQENLSLETLSKIESCLDLQIILEPTLPYNAEQVANETTLEAIREAMDMQVAYKSGTLKAKPIDLSSVDNMLLCEALDE